MPRTLTRRPTAATTATASFELIDVGLTILTPPSYNLWADYGASLYRLGNLSKWALGDWLIYGEQHFADSYTQAIDATQRSRGTLMNIVTVCRAFTHHDRRADLSFSHHQALVPYDAATRRRWLDEASRNQWGVRELRAQLDAQQATVRATRAEARRSLTGIRTIQIRQGRDSRVTIAAQYGIVDISEDGGHEWQRVAHGDPVIFDRDSR